MKKLYVTIATLAPLSAFAAYDVSAITDLSTDIAAIGAAIFGIYVAIKGIKLIRRAL